MAVLELGEGVTGLKEVGALTVEFHTVEDVAAGKSDPDFTTDDIVIEEMSVQSVSATKDNRICLDLGCASQPWYILIDAGLLKAMNKVAKAAGLK